MSEYFGFSDTAVSECFIISTVFEVRESARKKYRQIPPGGRGGGEMPTFHPHLTLLRWPGPVPLRACSGLSVDPGGSVKGG